MTNAEDCPVGTLAVIAVGNVENIKAFKTSDKRWSFAAAPELGLNELMSTNGFVTVQKVLKTNQEVVPRKRPYDVESISAHNLEIALEAELGGNEEDSGDYYDDYTGLNGFYHKLAGNDRYGHDDKSPKYEVVKSGPNLLVLHVPALGNFEAVDKITEFMAESGDADSNVVFKFNNRYFQKQGYLDSYEGGHWDGRLTEVKPVEKTITVWEQV